LYSSKAVWAVVLPQLHQTPVTLIILPHREPHPPFTIHTTRVLGIMYHTTVLIYRLVNKGPGFFIRILFEHLIYRGVFAWLLWFTSFLFEVGQPTDSYLQFTGANHSPGINKPMGVFTRFCYGCAAQVIAEKLIADRSPWECLHTAYWNLYSLISAAIAHTLMYSSFFLSACIRFAGPWFASLNIEIPVPKPKPWYTYEKLKEGEIRLLGIHRNYLFWVSYNIYAVPINHGIPYEAISYAWGDRSDVEEVTLNNRRFATTRTVGDILRRRSKLIGLWPGNMRFVWLDYICINQEDIDERNYQVTLMRQIYQRASRVMVCLGDGPDASKAGWLLLKIYALSTVNTLEELSNRCALDKNTPSWQALSRFFAHPWFSRVWVIQEVAVASKVWVTYGGGLLDWELVLWGICTFSRPEMASHLSTATAEVRRNIPLTLQQGVIVGIIRNKIQRKDKLSLREAITLCTGFQATDPRDKIYALLGLVTDDLDLRAWVDYRKPTEQLYLETARFLLSQEESPLQILNYAGTGYPWNPEFASLPSWVPDLSCPPNTSSLDGGIQPFPYKACGRLQHDAQLLLSAPPGQIRLRGSQADEIAFLAQNNNFSLNGATDAEMQTFFQDRALWLKNCLSLIQDHVPDPYHTLQPRAEAFWRTLLGDRTVEGRPAPAEYADCYAAMEELTFSPPDEQRTSFTSQRALILKSLRFQGQTAASIRGRRFAVTRRGFMGLVPPGTEAGDVICVFAGANTPFVVRQLEKGWWELVGECYFLGIMDGEMVDPVAEMEVFTLC